jgi:hypothetical protein
MHNDSFQKEYKERIVPCEIILAEITRCHFHTLSVSASRQHLLNAFVNYTYTVVPWIGNDLVCECFAIRVLCQRSVT